MMKYRDIEYTVVQGIGRHLWKWSASVADPEWQAAIEGPDAGRGGPTMFARIGVMRERVFDSSRKDKHWGRRKLARDQ